MICRHSAFEGSTRAPLSRPSTAFLALLFALVALSSTSCASMKSRGDDAFARGDYRAAAEFYEAASRERPGDKDVAKLLVESRVRFLRELAGKAWAEREAGRVDTAMPAVEDLLATQDRWKISGDEATGRRTVELVTWANAAIDAEVSTVLAKKWPLAAERVLTKRAALLVRPHFSTTSRRLRLKVQASGEAACTLAESKSTSALPYFSRLAGKLCAHFGRGLVERVELPYAASNVRVRYAVPGITEGERHALERVMLEGLQRSPHWDASSERVFSGGVSGTRSLGVERRKIEMTRPWVESVPYEAIETYEEPFERYYQDTESYTEQEPYTAYETRYRSCGNSRCPESVPVTRYRTVQRTRPVTKSKTMYRTRQRKVTKYRDEQRIFSFEAEEVTGTYATDVSVTLDLTYGQPLALRLTSHDRLQGIDHDASFPEADVSPSRANLPTVEEWFTAQLASLPVEIAKDARAQWRGRFCREGTWDLESAATCAWSEKLDTPARGKAVLAEGLGPEVDAVLSL